MRKIRIACFFALVASVAFSFGIFVAAYQIQPFGMIQTLVKKTQVSDTVLEREIDILKKEYQPLDFEMENIREIVRAFIPGINTMSELEKIKRLRNLVFSKVKLGNKAVPYRYSMDPDLFVRLYLKGDTYSALCADMALTYHFLLMAFDIPSNIVGLFKNLNPPIDSHVSVQVYSTEFGKAIISDPTFNMFVVDSATGIPMNYLGLKNAIKEKKIPL